MSCKRCLFDELNYPEIKLDENGICDICEINEERIEKAIKKRSVFSLNDLLLTIKNSKKGKYDCLIGISGGTDSSYLVYLAKKWGLNPLLMHVDGGWNSETSVINIERIVTKSGFDFVTEVLPWNEMRDVQRAFIESNVLDIDLPFDNAMLKYNYLIAKKYGIKIILNGYSTFTEGIMPSNFTHFKLDKRNIVDIHNTFGTVKRNKLKFTGVFDHFYFTRLRKIKFIYPLDLIDYNKNEAKSIIKNEFQWQDYGGKHYENVFTRFYQGKILPKKFNIDKRISHLSMLICINQLTKSEALNIIQNEKPYTNELLERDDEIFFLKKLQIEKNSFDKYINSKGISHRKFKSDLDYYDNLKPLYRIFNKVFKFQFFD